MSTVVADRCPYCGEEGSITEAHLLDCSPFDNITAEMLDGISITVPS